MKFMSKTSIESDWRSPITYYSNHDACYKLLISGDIELNPGPNSGNRVGNQEEELLSVIFVTKLFEQTLSDLCVNTGNC